MANLTLPFIDEKELISLSSRVVNSYISRGSIPKREREDVQMAIIEKFLNKQDKISERFEGNSKKQTYCIAILNRMCCEIIRKEIKFWNLVASEPLEIFTADQKDTSFTTVVKDEMHFLNNILVMMGNLTPKVRICISFYFQLEPFTRDISIYSNHLPKEQISALIQLDKELSKGEIFHRLSEMTNLVEEKELKADAIRMWLNKQIVHIISRLNGPYFRTHYDKDSFQILFEYYHQYFKNRNTGLNKT